jgi:hypothetical protein
MRLERAVCGRPSPVILGHGAGRGIGGTKQQHQTESGNCGGGAAHLALRCNRFPSSSQACRYCFSILMCSSRPDTLVSSSAGCCGCCCCVVCSGRGADCCERAAAVPLGVPSPLRFIYADCCEHNNLVLAARLLLKICTAGPNQTALSAAAAAQLRWTTVERGVLLHLSVKNRSVVEGLPIGMCRKAGKRSVLIAGRDMMKAAARLAAGAEKNHAASRSSRCRSIFWLHRLLHHLSVHILLHPTEQQLAECKPRQLLKGTHTRWLPLLQRLLPPWTT